MKRNNTTSQIATKPWLFYTVFSLLQTYVVFYFFKIKMLNELFLPVALSQTPLQDFFKGILALNVSSYSLLILPLSLLLNALTIGFGFYFLGKDRKMAALLVPAVYIAWQMLIKLSLFIFAQ